MNKAVLVIGAGAAGIAAASRLMAHGFRNVTVLEAESRIGGRVHTVRAGANVLDMGAQWCHGQKDNVVYAMARDQDVLQPNTLRYDDFIMYRSDGSVLPESVSASLMQLAIEILESDDAEMRRFGGSLGEFVVGKYRAALRRPEYAHIDEALAAQFIDFFHKYENSYEASDSWFEASCGGYVDYWDCEGDLLLNWRDRGYVTVFDLLMNKLPGSKQPPIPLDEHIRCGKVVRQIDWSTSARQPKVRVECTDGSHWQADHVICTVSLGVLKEQHARGLFVPALPAAKRAAIEGLTLGTVDKIYAHFAEPFWPADWKGFSLLWTQEDRDRLSAEDAWLEGVFGFYRVDYQPNVLCGWISGARARHMETLPQEVVEAGVVRLLQQFLGRTMAVQTPVEVQRTQWYSNPNFRGSYTFRSTRADELRTEPAALAAPLLGEASGEPVLQFAGEATHDHYYSTVHGAVESGWREAGRLIELYNGRKSHL